jgi:hypothetical protein
MTTAQGPGFRPGEEESTAERIRRLAHDAPPADLAGRIAQELRRMPSPRPHWWSRLAELLDRPGWVWGYRLATLGVLTGILAGIWLLVARRDAVGPGASGPSSPAHLATVARSGQSGAVVSITFVFYAPKATSVALVGSFNDWDPQKAPMNRGKDGNWTLQVKLPSGRYEYLFLVDGAQYETDPLAVELRPDGLGHENAVLRI